MSEVGRVLMGVGALLIVAGAALWLMGRTGFRGLPGDIRIEGPRGGFYLPIVTCLLLSLFLTAAVWLWQTFSRR